jgi:prevent-host-death family protein
MVPMKTISALDVRARFGQVIDEAAAGERFIVERAGQPVAAIVPLADLQVVDPERIRAARLAAVDQLRRMAAADPRPGPSRDEIVRWIREARDASHR